MQRKNLSRTYAQRVGLTQIIDEVTTSPPPDIQKPVSAGGQTVIPPTLSQEYLQFTLGIDEVPSWMRAKVWALITRMNNLTIVDGDFDFERMMHGVRAMLRAMMWERKITLGEMTQIEYYVGVQLRRSKSGRQLTLVSPGYQQILHQESTNNQSAIDDKPQTGAALGILAGKNNQRGGMH